jgi:hypothetical protein
MNTKRAKGAARRRKRETSTAMVAVPKTRDVSKPSTKPQATTVPPWAKGATSILKGLGVTAAALHPQAVPALVTLLTAVAAITFGTDFVALAFFPFAEAFGKRLASCLAPEARGEKDAARLLWKKIAFSGNTRRATSEGVRKLLEILAEEAVEPLADLTAEYVAGDRPPDRFLRGTAGLLADITSEELRALGNLLQRVSSADVLEKSSVDSFVTLMYGPLQKGRQAEGPSHLQYRRRVYREAPQGVVGPPTLAEWEDLEEVASPDSDQVLRVFQLLKRHCLGDDPRPTGFIGIADPLTLQIDHTTTLRLAALLKASRGE